MTSRGRLREDRVVKFRKAEELLEGRWRKKSRWGGRKRRRKRVR